MKNIYLALVILVSGSAQALPSDIAQEVNHYLNHNGHKKLVNTKIAQHDKVKNETIEIKTSQINAKNIEKLKKYKSVHIANDLGGKLNHKHLVLIAQLKNVHCLDLAGAKISDENFTHLASHAGLHTLNISWIDVSDAGLAKLSSLKGLENLDLVWTNISDIGLINLTKSLPKIKSLNLSKTKVSDGAIQQLSAKGIRVTKI